MDALSVLASPDVAIDLGTANARVACAAHGVLADVPSAAPPGSPRPLVHGVVADVDAAARVLAPLLRLSRGCRLTRPRALVCAPSDASEAERRALVDATLAAGAGRVAVLPEPLAAALGAGLDPTSPRPRAIVDVGEGVTDVAVLLGGEVVHSAALRLACGDLRSAVRRAVRESQGIELDDDEAERILRALAARGDAETDWVPLDRPAPPSRPGEGRVVKSFAVLVRARPVVEALDAFCGRVADFVGSALGAFPVPDPGPGVDEDLCVTGGGALLPGLVTRIAEASRLRARAAPDPLRAVVLGAVRLLPRVARDRLWSQR